MIRRGPGHRQTRRARHWGGAGLIAALLLVLVAVGVNLLRPAPAARAQQAVTAGERDSAQKTAPDAGPVTQARPAASVVEPEVPVSARLPSGAVVPVRGVSTRTDGVLDVPHDIRTAGWWQGGARIGDPFGSTLIAAHVDSTTQGLGPYVELLSSHPGQRVVVRSRTLRQTFVVRSLRLVPQGSLVKQSDIYAASGPRRLTLVTCAPPYVKARGGYQNLAVVVADPVGPPRSGAGR